MWYLKSSRCDGNAADGGGSGSTRIVRKHSNGIIILNVCMFAVNDREANGVLWLTGIAEYQAMTIFHVQLFAAKMNLVKR